jgi:hypothetical protein
MSRWEAEGLLARFAQDCSNDHGPASERRNDEIREADNTQTMNGAPDRATLGIGL